MAESLQIIPDDKSLKSSLNAYKGWMTRYENQIKSFNERINQLISRFTIITDCSCIRSFSYENTLGRIGRYSNALRSKNPNIDPKVVEDHLKSDLEVVYDQNERVRQCERIENAIETEITQKKSAINTILEKKEGMKKKVDVLSDIIEYSQKNDAGEPMFNEIKLALINRFKSL